MRTDDPLKSGLHVQLGRVDLRDTWCEVWSGSAESLRRGVEYEHGETAYVARVDGEDLAPTRVRDCVRYDAHTVAASWQWKNRCFRRGCRRRRLSIRRRRCVTGQRS